MLWVRKLMGWIMIGMAVYFVMPILGQKLGGLLLACTALAATVHLGWIDRTLRGNRAFGVFKTAAAIAGLALAASLTVSSLSTKPAVPWQPYSDQVLAEARSLNKPVIMDFSATWCPTCRHLDEVTFNNPKVVKESKTSFVMVKVDLTHRANAALERLISQYGIRGLPTVVFLDSQGKERSDLRLAGFLGPDEFLGRMAKLAEQTRAPVRSEKQTEIVPGSASTRGRGAIAVPVLDQRPGNGDTFFVKKSF
jgi:thioredoxin:protein disulfide reductase